MCGICGFTGKPDRHTLDAMTLRLAHRGPDGSGTFSGGGIHLGHRRLAIIDLREEAAQPMHTPDGKLTIVYNGEAYNFLALKVGLIAEGYTFRTSSDTEVILAGFERHGMDFLSMIEGMFSIALWDRQKKELLLVRDRLGVKPLYYAAVGTGIVFSSEIKSLLSHPEVGRRIDHSALSHYMMLRYTLGEDTLIAGVKRVEPGTFLRFSDGKIACHRYWMAPERVKDNTLRDTTVERYAELFDESVRLRMTATDVGAGIFLSSGLDSSAIAHSAQRTTSRLKAFTVHFGLDVDEIRETELFALESGIDLHAVRIRAEDYLDLERVAAGLDHPVGDSIVIPMDRLAKAAARETKVVLSGEGADESMGSYVHHRAARMLDMIAAPSRKSHTLGFAGSLASALPPSFLNLFFNYETSLGTAGKKLAVNFLKNGSAGDAAAAYLGAASLYSAEEFDAVARFARYDEFAGDFKKRFSKAGGSTFQEQFIRFDLANWLPNYTMHKLDAILMSHSLEGREPYMSHHLIEHVLRSPMKQISTATRSKAILRDAMRGRLPEAVREREKRSFYFPYIGFFGTGFRSFAREIVMTASMRELFKETELAKIVDDAFDRPHILTEKRLFSFVMLSLWMREVLE